MKTKHTPGPWSSLEYQANPDSKKWAISCLRPAKNGCRENPQVAICNEMGGSSIGEDEGRANARLIAAAPDLLEAIVALRDEAVKISEKFDVDGKGFAGSAPIWAYILDATEAIAKAGGAK